MTRATSIINPFFTAHLEQSICKAIHISLATTNPKGN